MLEQCLKNFIRNARTDRYNLRGSIDENEKQQPSYFDDGDSVGGNLLPSNSTIEALFSLSATIDFIYCWLKGLEQNLLEISNALICILKL